MIVAIKVIAILATLFVTWRCIAGIGTALIPLTLYFGRGNEGKILVGVVTIFLALLFAAGYITYRILIS